jgi:hypothetical protein
MENEAAQQALGQGISRVAEAIMKLQAAHTSFHTAFTRGGPDFAPRLKSVMDLLDNLFADAQEVHGEVEPHRGQRLPPACNNDPACPVHGQVGSLAYLAEGIVYCIGPRPEGPCSDPECNRVHLGVAHTHTEDKPHRASRVRTVCSDTSCPVHGIGTAGRGQTPLCTSMDSADEEDALSAACDDPNCPIHGEGVRRRTGPHANERLFICSVAAKNRATEG